MRRHAELNLLDSAGSLVPAVRLVAHSEARELPPSPG